MSKLFRGNIEISTAVRKATSSEESAPKRKHVRACGVYTWDHKSSREFWDAVRLLPIQNDQVQCFKMLILVHKVIQEGHKSVLKEAPQHANWLRSVGKTFTNYGAQGYARLISEYVRLLLHKLEFHRTHPAFNGTFEYEEYLSLRSTDDPNEGFEVILDLMNLQDAIDDFQRLVFSTLNGRYGNECKISSLTAMVAESYGIYRFVTSMLRAMHASSDTEALEPLRGRYASQHKRLRAFYFDCTTLKYLTSLINIPELPAEPPNLFVIEDDAPALPRRPIERNDTAATTAPPLSVQPTGDWWQAQQQEELERQRQAELFAMQQQQQAEELARQQELQRQAEEDFRRQQQMLLQQQQQAEQDFLASQQQQHAQGQVAQLEQQLFALQNAKDAAEQLLSQYDQRVQGLEQELEQLQNMNTLAREQFEAREQQLQQLEEDVTNWRKKYEALAKLYSQLRQEHLDLLTRSKKWEAKAKSAQEAIEKRERLERDLKAKNLELADLIRERDRARYELDKVRGQHRDETDKLDREISLLNDRLNDPSKSADVSGLMASHNNEIALLEEKLRQLELNGGPDVLRAKEDEIDILKETIRTMEEALHDLSADQNNIGDEKLNAILDAILISASQQVQDSLFEFDNPMETGNKNSTPAYALSIVEKASSHVDEFSTAFNDLLAEGVQGSQADVIRTAMLLASATSDTLANIKGLCSMSNDESVIDAMTYPTQTAAAATVTFYDSLHSDLLAGLEIDDKIELVITNQVEVQQAYQELIQTAEKLLPSTNLHSGDIGEMVDDEMGRVARAVQDANDKLTALLAQPRKFSHFDRHLNEAIISAAVAITSAIAALIKAATDCQNEIVAAGRGTDSKHQYYKKNHRWTQGLISAARAIAGSTNILIETADTTLSGKSEPEELIVASKEVAASTAQLVAASRSRTGYASKTQEKLENASKSVNSACNQLVSKVQDIISRNSKAAEHIDYSSFSSHQFKTAAMEQQVEVLKLEQQLVNSRNRLFQIRKEEYARREEEEGE